MLPSTKIALAFSSAFLIALSMSPVYSSDCTTAECYGQKAVQDYDSIFGTPEAFLQGFEDDIKPMLTPYLGLAVAVAGFILVIRSLSR